MRGATSLIPAIQMLEQSNPNESFIKEAQSATYILYSSRRAAGRRRDHDEHRWLVGLLSNRAVSRTTD